MVEASDGAIVEEFLREGCVVVPGVLGRHEVEDLRAKAEHYFEIRESLASRHVSYGYQKVFVLRFGAELDTGFRAVSTKQPLLSLARAILGDEPRFNALNVIRNEPGQAISRWHVDDVVEFPLPDDIPRFDARLRMPVLWFTVQLPLTDITAPEHGPTQYIPCSHYSGRFPQGDPPTFEGRGPKSVLCRAGDIYLTNHQTWHRGSPNTSNQVRFVMQIQYAARWADARFRGVA